MTVPLDQLHDTSRNRGILIVDCLQLVMTELVGDGVESSMDVVVEVGNVSLVSSSRLFDLRGNECSGGKERQQAELQQVDHVGCRSRYPAW